MDLHANPKPDAPGADASNASDSKNQKPTRTPDAKADLKTLPLPELEKRLGSSPTVSPGRSFKTTTAVWAERD